MRRQHTHRCAICRTGSVPCSGSRVDNYDGWPTVLCSVEADMPPGERFICDDCQIELETDGPASLALDDPHAEDLDS